VHYRKPDDDGGSGWISAWFYFSCPSPPSNIVSVMNMKINYLIGKKLKAAV
jgi:hypothetical protein